MFHEFTEYNQIVSPCLVHPCDTEEQGGCSDICEKVGDQSKCKCNGLRILDKEGKLCREHPCDSEGNGGCTHYCTKVGRDERRAQCACPQDWKLKEDGLTCEIGQ